MASFRTQVRKFRELGHNLLTRALPPHHCILLSSPFLPSFPALLIHFLAMKGYWIRTKQWRTLQWLVIWYNYVILFCKNCSSSFHRNYVKWKKICYYSQDKQCWDFSLTYQRHTVWVNKYLIHEINQIVSPFY